MDGVAMFNNTEQGKLIPILMIVHSLKKSHDSLEPSIVLEPSRPVIIGYFHGRGKPDLHEFLHLFVKELDRLGPDNIDRLQTVGLQFTVKLRCIRTDGPMRSYLKMCKYYSGYWSCERCIQPGFLVKVKQAKKKSGRMVKKLSSLQFSCSN